MMISREWRLTWYSRGMKRQKVDDEAWRWFTGEWPGQTMAMKQMIQTEQVETKAQRDKCKQKHS